MLPYNSSLIGSLSDSDVNSNLSTGFLLNVRFCLGFWEQCLMGGDLATEANGASPECLLCGRINGYFETCSLIDCLTRFLEDYFSELLKRLMKNFKRIFLLL